MSKTLPLAAALFAVGLAHGLAAEPPARVVGDLEVRRARSTWLFVETHPPGARVELDGQLLGRSDGLFQVRAGSHTVTLELEGYQPSQQVLNVDKGRVTRLVLELREFPSPLAEPPFSPAAAGPSGPLVVQPRPRYSVLNLPWGSARPADEPAPAAVLVGHEGQVHWVEFAPHGRLLASAGADGTVRLWSVPSGAPGHVLPVHDSRLGVHSVAFSPDGKTLACCSGSVVRLWAPDTGRLLSAKGDLGPAQSLAFSADGKTIAVGTGADTVALCDARSLQVQSVLRTTPPNEVVMLGHDESVRRIVYSQDGRLLACAGGWRPHVPGRVTVWDTLTARLLSSFEVRDGCVRAAAFSPDNRLLAYAASSTIKLVAVADLPRPAASR